MMLKKLTKYGNSNALVLDKSLLGLLGLAEGDTVKLRVEGESLIVKKADAVSEVKSIQLEAENEVAESQKYAHDSMAEQVAMDNARMAKAASLGQLDTSKVKGLSEFTQKYQALAKKHNVNHQEMLANKAYMAEAQTVMEAVMNKSNDEKLEAMNAVQEKHFPQMRAFTKAVYKLEMEMNQNPAALKSGAELDEDERSIYEKIKGTFKQVRNGSLKAAVSQDQSGVLDLMNKYNVQQILLEASKNAEYLERVEIINATDLSMEEKMKQLRALQIEFYPDLAQYFAEFDLLSAKLAESQAQ